MVGAGCGMAMIDIQRGQSITLKVGANTVTINNTSITINGIMVDVVGLAMLNMNAPMSNLAGDATMIIKGGLVKVN